MSCNHPNMSNFKKQIEKRDIDDEKIRNFERWMQGKKFQEEWRVEAEKLLELARECKSAPLPRQNPTLNRTPSSHGKQEKSSNQKALEPTDIIPAPFHNPYTFIPFPKNAPERHEPTPLTIDEIETERITGIIDLQLETISPLLSSEQVPSKKDREQQKNFKSMRIGNDVIVPASSIRGMLRSLCAIVSGSALDYVDENLWLCQGRDTNLTVDKDGRRCDLFLAEVSQPGNSQHGGKIRVGAAFLVPTANLNILNDKTRKDFVENKEKLWINNPLASKISCSSHCDASHPFRVKVSGRKVNSKGKPHEGAFNPADTVEIELPVKFWSDYQGRNRHGQRPELKKGDLVWVEAVNPTRPIQSCEDVKSLQWARWGRTGVNFVKQLPQHMLPDYMRNDGKVDITSDLFGSIPLDGKAYASFASRIRPENLVFRGAQTFTNELPPLSAPHPGCIAFYLDNDDYDTISIQDLPRGYKVYRTSRDHGNAPPWKYATQPTFNKRSPQDFNSCNMAKQVELVKEKSNGTLKIAFRALNKRELSLILLLLSCDLRIGGGKPLGLGHCRVTHIDVYDELGSKFLSYIPEKAKLPEEFADVPEEYSKRAELYCKTQEPVAMMRYPRAVNGNKRGGMCWFSDNAAPRKGRTGLETTWLARNLQAQCGGKDQVRAQGLPFFNPANPESDWLYGYDVEHIVAYVKDKRKYIEEFADGSKNTNCSGPQYENDSPNRRTRQEWRNKR